MLNQSLLFSFLNGIKVICGHLILQFKLLNLGVQVFSLLLDFLNDSLNVSLLVNELLVGDNEHIKLFLLLLELNIGGVNLLLESLLFLLGSLTLSSRDFSLHLLNLILAVILELLLSLLLLLELVDRCLQVSRSR